MPKNTINHHVGKRLRLRRLTLGMTQDALARLIGVAAQQVQKYETGTNVMNVNRLHEFAATLKVPVSYFFDEAASSLNKKTAKKSRKDSLSDRESLEVVKSFKRIKDPALRKRLADLARIIAIKASAG